MNIRFAKEADLATIVKIYNQSIPNRRATADTEPITVASRLDWYHHRPPNRPLWVATRNNEIIGWMSLQNFYGRPAYSQTAEISIYVATEYQRQGIGSKLLEKAIASCEELDLTVLLAFIFAHNLPSIKLFSAYGFKEWGYLPDIAVLDDRTRSLSIWGLKIFE